MKTILVPTDFSQNAYEALLYAADLAERQRAQLRLLHVFHQPTYWYESLAEIRKKESFLRTESLRKLEELENSPALAGRRLKMTTEVRNGKVIDEITDLIRERKADIIVMGSQPLPFSANWFPQTLTTEVVERTSCPVLVIPAGAVYRPIRRIVSAVDYHDSDLLHTIELTELASVFNADITLLHIARHPSFSSADSHRLDELRSKATRYTQYQPIRTQLVEGENVVAQLNEYADRNGMDLLAMASKKRSALEKTRGYSFTRQMIMQTTLPLLVYKAFDLEAFL